MFIKLMSRPVNIRKIRTGVVVGLSLGLLFSLIALNQVINKVEREASKTSEVVTILPGASTAWWKSVKKNILQSEYDVTWQPQSGSADISTSYQAVNRAHNLRTHFTPGGPVVFPRTIAANDDNAPWRWTLSLVSYGYQGELHTVTSTKPAAAGNRVTYQRGELIEWYINDERGLEQGFILNAPPIATMSSHPLVLQLAISGDLQPKLIEAGQTIMLSTLNGQEVLHYGQLHAFDANGRTLPSHFELVPENQQVPATIRIVVDDSTAVYPLTIDPLSTTPNWTAESNQAGAEFGFPAVTAGDVNGDGYDDIIVGAKSYDNGQSNEGRVFVYYGSETGLSTTADWIAESNDAGALFGRTVGAAGDVNNDGYDDIIVGATIFASPSFGEGRVFVYYGGPGGLSCGGGCPVDATAAADWTADGNQNNGRFGRWVNSAGDVNGDGFDDILVGAWLYDGGQSDEGRVFAYYGSATGLSCGSGCPVDATSAADWMVEGNQTNTGFGSSVAPAGDVNGDGFDDVIVGGYAFNNGQTDEGMVFVYYGSASGLPCGSGCPADAITTADWSAEGNQANADLGSVNTAGDVNGDGFDDIIVAATHYDNGETDEGMVFIFHGSAAGLSCGSGCPVDVTSAADWSAEGNQLNSEFGGGGGASVTAGDVNSDGYGDVIIGARSFDHPEVDEGIALLFLGSITGISCGTGCPVDALTAADWLAEVDNPAARFGISVGSARDVNGDGYTDVIVGASDYTNGQAGEGGVFVYYGLTSTPSPTYTPSPTPTNTPPTTPSPTATSTLQPTGVDVSDFNGQANGGGFAIFAALLLLGLLIASFYRNHRPADNDG